MYYYSTVVTKCNFKVYNLVSGNIYILYHCFWTNSNKNFSFSKNVVLEFVQGDFYYPNWSKDKQRFSGARFYYVYIRDKII